MRIAFAACAVFTFSARGAEAPVAGAAGLHYSTYSEDQDFFLRAIARAESTGTVEAPALHEKPFGGIVNHHLLAGEFIARFFIEISRFRTPETFIIIAPNHQSRGFDPIVLSRAEWKTPFGRISTDTAVIRTIQAETGIPADERAFFNEHSVGALVPFIKKLFPRAKVVPLILKPRLDPGVRKRLVPVLARLLARQNCFLVLSMDCSHKKPAALAFAEDAKTIPAIQSLDTGHRRLQALDIDCPNGLEIAAATMVRLNARRVTILNHDHSARMLGRPGLPGTSYVTVLFGRPALFGN